MGGVKKLSNFSALDFHILWLPSPSGDPSIKSYSLKRNWCLWFLKLPAPESRRMMTTERHCRVAVGHRLQVPGVEVNQVENHCLSQDITL